MTNCTRCHSQLERGDLRCPVCAEPSATAGEVEVTKTRVLRCKDCHAVMRYSAELESAACVFCGARVELEYSTDPVERVEGIVPFRLTHEGAAKALKAWLTRRGFLAPGDLASAARIASLKPVLWSAWLVSGEMSVAYRVDVRGAGKKAAWGPATGQVQRTFSQVIIPATRGLAVEEIADLGMFDAADLTAFQLTELATQAPSGVAVEDFGVTRSAARSRIYEGLLNHARGAVVERITGDTRRLHSDLLIEGLQTQRVLLPAWVMAYRYGRRKFRVVVHGQHGFSVTGRSPLSPWRVLGLFGAGLALCAWLMVILAFYATRR